MTPHRWMLAPCLLATWASAQFGAQYEGAPIHYGRAPRNDAVTRLRARIEAGETVLRHEERFGYLRTLLAELGIPVSSQGLVFSKTSFQLRQAAGDVLEYLLFKNEPRLEAEIRGTSTFAADFAASGPRDGRGRSLRDLDLQERLFRYPCSYLIYSPSFDALPEPILDIVYTRLWRILTGRFGRRSWGLSREQRQAILDILLATKSGLPASWRRVEVR